MTMKKSYPSTKSLRAWIADLLVRITFFKDWTRLVVSYVKDNKAPSPLPPIFNIAILQSSARTIALLIYQLKFSYQVLDNGEERQIQQSSTTAHDIGNGIIIDGIYLDGAQWNNQCHQVVDYTDQRRTHHLPSLLCKLVPKSKENVDATNIYECPVYLTALRALSASEAAKHLVGTITIPYSETESFWTTRSIAGILEIIGKPSFDSQTQYETIRMIKSIEITFPTGGTSADLRNLLRRNPADRLPLKDAAQHTSILKNTDTAVIEDNYIKRKKTLNREN
ncbi:unnamed protein product [Rotaria sordida]|uniref:Dynein heavy chain C-terminal domain-containing protein n=2 Tax=Rotaria sordida TaxID=392033 RepID=A0A820AJ76_9BILA|nr:unnamed protein product [Rotaria sordida]CAF4191714.1 unnamed protein product [Rotaria sordida]